jgi:hypothetical protein
LLPSSLNECDLATVCGGFDRSPVDWEENGMRFQGWLTDNQTGQTSLEGYVTSNGWDPRIEYAGARWDTGSAPELWMQQGDYQLYSE